MDKIGDVPFHVICDLWGVDEAVKAANRMGLMPSKEQIEVARQKEQESQERFNAIFKPKEE